MAYIKKTFSCPKSLWDPFQAYIDDHPELSYSGVLQKLIRDFTGEIIHVQRHSQPSTH